MSAEEAFEAFNAPTHLRVKESVIRRMLLISSCQMQSFGYWMEKKGVPTDLLIINHASQLPDDTPNPVADYDLALIQIPVRSIAPEHNFFAPVEERAARFENAMELLNSYIEELLRYNIRDGLTTFITNFLVPQANGFGRFMPRYDLSNPVFWFEEMNRRLFEITKRYKGVYVLDVNGIANMYGKKHILDDSLFTYSHSAVLSDWGYEQDKLRLHPVPSVNTVFQVQSFEFIQSVMSELESMYRTLRQVDQVKLVAVDLDDTMWRGVLAEDADFDVGLALDGWPFGLAEALSILKSRGVMLAVLSKNDEDTARRIWDQVHGKHFPMSEFTAVAINWNQKADNLLSILNAVNILPSAVVFLDDNPVERAAVKAALPGCRVLGASPYEFRRVLLWSAETQVVSVTDEGARRNDMVKAQIVRETARSKMSREEFLASLDIKIEYSRVDSPDDRRYARVIELLNKSNQFNTNGQRWTHEEVADWIAQGNTVDVIEVEDRYTNYGLVAILIGRPGQIQQYVMSCRVVGLGVEERAISTYLEAAAHAGFDRVSATIVNTNANGLVRDLWSRCGGKEVVPGLWEIAVSPSETNQMSSSAGGVLRRLRQRWLTT